MRRLLVLTLVSLSAFLLVPLVGMAASNPVTNQRSHVQEDPQVTSQPSTTPSVIAPEATNSPEQASASRRTVTATGTSRVRDEAAQFGTVYAVQVMGPIDENDPTKTYGAYIGKMNAVRDAVLAAGVRADHVTTAVPSTSSTGPGQVGFNSIFHFKPAPGEQSVKVPQAAWAAGASMVYNNMPGPQIGATGLDLAKLDSAIAEARAMARQYAQHAALPGETVAEEIDTALVITGQPEREPTEWQIALTITFEVDR